MMEAANNNPNRTQLETFMRENFSEEGELDVWSPPDWQKNPPLLQRIEDLRYRKWALDLNKEWKSLSRKIKPEVAEHPDRHSLIYVDNGFIVPGGRFRGEY